MTYPTQKIELKPNAKVLEHFAQATGTSRFAYNWGLAKFHVLNQPYVEARNNNIKEEGIKLFLKEIGVKYKPKLVKLPKTVKESYIRKELNAVKKKDYPWMYSVSKCVPQQAIKDLGRALSDFYSGAKGFPKWKKKSAGRDSFYIDNFCAKVIERPKIVNGRNTGETISYLRIPKCDEIRMCENVRYMGKIMKVVISRTADKWFASITFDVGYMPYHDCDTAIALVSTGVDLGIKVLATLADGMEFYSRKAYEMLEAKLSRLQRKLSKMVKGSNNYHKLRIKIARFHAKIANMRKDCLHKITTYLAKTYAIIGVETLNVKGMLKNHCLAKAIADASFGEFIRQLQYKGEWYGSVVVRADWFYPSSKTCSSCGHKMAEMPLKIREWDCPSCGTHHNRDHNAAINLENYAFEHGSTQMAFNLAYMKLLKEKTDKFAVSSTVGA